MLLQRLSKSGYGCHIGNVLAGALGYADDIVLISPTRSGLIEMLKICELYSDEYDIIFNASKSKMLVFGDQIEVANVEMQSEEIPIVKYAKHLGNFIGKEALEKQVNMAINDMYFRTNILMSKFRKCHYNVKYKLFKSYCMSVYGSALWNFEKVKVVEKFLIAWRKCVRRLLDLSYKTKRVLLPAIVNDIPPDVKLHKRFLKFFHACLKSETPAKTCARLITHGIPYSNGAESANFICYMYNRGKTIVKMIDQDIIYNHSENNLQQGALIRDLMDYRFDNSNEYEPLSSILQFLCENVLEYFP